MEMNKDEADKCLNLARKYIQQGNKEKAEKFVRKAQKLYPSKKCDNVMDEVNNMADENVNAGSSSGGGGGTSGKPSPGSSSYPEPSNDEATTSSADYTQEQIDAVKRIRKCKNYYEILGVSKTSTETELKKAYRKLALAFHPDKNNAPGASEAFKAIGNAYAVLSNTEKKRQYDLYGDEDSAPRSRRSNGGFYQYEDPSHGFQGDMTAEEIFNMFFGGGMPGSSVYVRRGGRWHRPGTHHSNHSHTQDTHTHYEESQGANLSALFQLVPVLILLLVSLFSSLFVSDPIYSFDLSHKYNVQRITSNLKVNYFVKDTFHQDFTGSLRRLEKQVEDEYVSHLRSRCFQEKSSRENLLWQARYSGSQTLFKKAQKYPTPSCNKLEELYNGASAA